MFYVLDTDHISLAQRQHPIVSSKLSAIPRNERAVTAVSLVEQLQGRLASIHRAKTEVEASMAIQLLLQTIEFYRSLEILPYEGIAVAEFTRLRQQKIRIGTQDLRIASIALSNDAIIVTRNRRDFSQISDLVILDWSQP